MNTPESPRRQYVPPNPLSPADILPTVYVRFKATGHTGYVSKRDFLEAEHEEVPEGTPSAAHGTEAGPSGDAADPTKLAAAAAALASMTKLELAAAAKARGVTLPAEGSKEEFIAAILAATP